MNRRTFLSGAGAILVTPIAGWASEGGLVLVVGSRSLLPAIGANEVRKIYLGVPLVLAEKEVVPLLNVTMPETKEMFLQKVLFMSGPVYERHLVGRVFRSGGSRIAEFQDSGALVNALANNSHAISFMSSSEAGKISTLKILGNL
jgi:hypothetical protein